MTKEVLDSAIARIKNKCTIFNIFSYLLISYIFIDQHIKKATQVIGREAYLLHKLKVLLGHQSKIKLSLEKYKYFKSLHELLTVHKKCLNDFALNEVNSILAFTKNLKSDITTVPPIVEKLEVAKLETI